MDELPSAAPSPAPSRLMVFMFTDVADSTRLKQPGALGAAAYAELARRHDTLFRSIIGAIPGADILKDVGDGFMAVFPTASDAVRAALRFQFALSSDSAFSQAGAPLPFRVRIGIHHGEVSVLDLDIHHKPKLIGPGADMTARLQALALPGQILVSRAAFNDARQYVREHPVCGEESVCPLLHWDAHGHYRFKGIDDPQEVFEVGADSLAPRAAPPDSEKARYVGSPDDELMRGWRPAAGQSIPGRQNWTLDQRLGEGGFGEAWLAHHAKSKERRVFKFCFDAERLRSFRREITLFRLLREALGDRPDIARLHDFQLDHAPFFLESEYSELGDLTAWAQAQGGIGTLPLRQRLQIVALSAEAVAAAHSVGILHKDIKPSNILMFTAADGSIRPRLADFGIGILTDRSRLEGRGITIAGFTGSQLTENSSSRTGTRMYAPPELDAGKPFTVQGDVYALGVLLYQMAVADLKRPLATGWEREVLDELLREDIAASTLGYLQQRLASAADLAQRLKALENRRAERAVAAVSVRREAARKRTLRWALAGAAAMVVVTALAAIAYVREMDLRDTAEFEAYIANIQAADASLTAHEPARVRARLDACAERLRNWEWKHLDARADLSIAVLRGHQGWVDAAAFSPDGTRIVTTSRDKTARLWDTATGNEIAVFRGHKGQVRYAAFSPDGTRIVTATADTARLWNSATGKKIAVLRGHGGTIWSAAFSPDGTRVVTTSGDKTARLWDSATGNEIAVLRGHKVQVWSAAFSPDGTRIVTASAEKTARLWDADTGQEIAVFRGHEGQVRYAAFSPDGTRIVTASEDKTTRLWDTATGNEIAVLRGHEGNVKSIAFNPDGNRVVTTSWDQTARVWDSATGQEIAVLRGHENQVHSAAFSPDGTRIVTASWDKTARLWDPATGHEIAVLRGHELIDVSAAFSPDGTRIVTVSRDKTARLWDSATGNAIAVLRGHEDQVRSAAFSPDGTRIVTASSDKTARVWDTATSNEIAVLLGHEGWVMSAAFSPDGTRIVIPTADTARLLDLATGNKEIAVLRGHEATVISAAFSPDGTRIVTASEDRTVRLWDTATCREVAVFRWHEDQLISAMFSPDGTSIVTASADGTARIYDSVPYRVRYAERHAPPPPAPPAAADRP